MAQLGDLGHAAALGAAHPAEREQPVGQRGAERPGQMVPLLGPCEAVMNSDSRAVTQTFFVSLCSGPASMVRQAASRC